MKRVIRWCIRIVALGVLADRIATANTLLGGRQSAWRTAPKEALQCFTLVLSLLLALAHPAYAVDGVIEINQVRAVAGSVSAADTPGFPVTISRRGSYRLTSNLSVGSSFEPGADITVIEITTRNVTLDLNGFAITSFNLLPPLPPGTDPGSGPIIVFGTGIGVDAEDQDNISVLNGTVQGMGFHGIVLGSNAHVERVRAIANGHSGIRVGVGSLVTGSTANDNNVFGIFADEFSNVTNNAANGNGNTGIRALQYSRVAGNTANNNDFIGIDVGHWGTVTDNTANANEIGGIRTSAGGVVTNNSANENNGHGIRAGSSGGTVTNNSANLNSGFGLSMGNVGYANNVFTFNNGSNSNPQVSTGGIEIGPNLCGFNTICP